MGVHCYRTFIRGLLDVTDNRVGQRIVPPPQTVRYDGDDPYLVVAADKGTATFSDIANALALEHGFWLGDAFASGGSAGYDHKKMGITARGAFEAVKHHFADLGVDIERQPFTVVGIGDMGGDVFGNGMLLSRHIQLVGAFNHQHIFLDPNPDPEASFGERRRLFDRPACTWADYDPALISPGGGVWPRSASPSRSRPRPGRCSGSKTRACYRRTSSARCSRRRWISSGTVASGPSSSRPASRTPRPAIAPTTASGSMAGICVAK